MILWLVQAVAKGSMRKDVWSAMASEWLTSVLHRSWEESIDRVAQTYSCPLFR